jgi:Rrf2 family protein
MLISKTCQYAIRALVFIQKETAEPNTRVGIKLIAKGVSAPMAFTSKILQTLSKFGFIGSVKGPGGGFYANDKTAGITILELITAIEGPNYCKQCLIGLPNCSDDNPCPAHFQYKTARSHMHELFKRLSIGELVDNYESNEELFRIGA